MSDISKRSVSLTFFAFSLNALLMGKLLQFIL